MMSVHIYGPDVSEYKVLLIGLRMGKSNCLENKFERSFQNTRNKGYRGQSSWGGGGGRVWGGGVVQLTATSWNSNF